jgi:UrcA family protein
MTTSLKLISSLIAAAAVSLISFSSGAAELADADAPARTVKAWDLDLAKAEDVRTLYRRLQSAATEVCKVESRQHWQKTRARAPLGWSQQCVQDAMDAAVRDTDNRHLAAVHSRAADLVVTRL